MADDATLKVMQGLLDEARDWLKFVVGEYLK
jgi:hypothetical protein